MKKKEGRRERESDMLSYVSSAVSKQRIFFFFTFIRFLLGTMYAWRHICYHQKKAFATKHLGSLEQKSMLSSVMKGYLSAEVPSGSFPRQSA